MENKRCFIIAEAGVNHNGDIGLAYKLIDAAKEALNGNQSTKEKLEILVNESNGKDSNSKYYNADPDKIKIPNMRW